jgi:hypothetical protein
MSNRSAFGCAVIVLVVQLTGNMVSGGVMTSIEARRDAAMNATGTDPSAVLREIERRVLWLATAIVHHGVERVDRDDHDRALVRAPAQR